jgi:hypothetical protein
MTERPSEPEPGGELWTQRGPLLICFDLSVPRPFTSNPPYDWPLTDADYMVIVVLPGK